MTWRANFEKLENPLRHRRQCEYVAQHTGGWKAEIRHRSQQECTLGYADILAVPYLQAGSVLRRTVCAPGSCLVLGV